MKIKIRDLRRRDQFKIDDKYINGYARICGVYATAVYSSLSRHAQFETQEAFPSIELIAEQHNISKPTVIKATKILESWNIIKIIREKDAKGRQVPNIYILIDKSDWKATRVKEINSESRVNLRTSPGKPDKKSRVNQVDCKDNTIYKDNTVKVIAEQSSAGSELNKMIELFEDVNPNFKRLFSNRTQRGALERMIKEHGKEKIEWVIKILKKTNGMRFAPTITRPTELEDKLGSLVTFLKKERGINNQNKIVKV